MPKIRFIALMILFTVFLQRSVWIKLLFGKPLVGRDVFLNLKGNHIVVGNIVPVNRAAKPEWIHKHSIDIHTHPSNGKSVRLTVF